MCILSNKVLLDKRRGDNRLEAYFLCSLTSCHHFLGQELRRGRDELPRSSSITEYATVSAIRTDHPYSVGMSQGARGVARDSASTAQEEELS